MTADLPTLMSLRFTLAPNVRILWETQREGRTFFLGAVGCIHVEDFNDVA